MAKIRKTPKPLDTIEVIIRRGGIEKTHKFIYRRIREGYVNYSYNYNEGRYLVEYKNKKPVIYIDEPIDTIEQMKTWAANKSVPAVEYLKNGADPTIRPVGIQITIVDIDSFENEGFDPPYEVKELNSIRLRNEDTYLEILPEEVEELCEVLKMLAVDIKMGRFD